MTDLDGTIEPQRIVLGNVIDTGCEDLSAKNGKKKPERRRNLKQWPLPIAHP
jgi:hypothetical protein